MRLPYGKLAMLLLLFAAISGIAIATAPSTPPSPAPVWIWGWKEMAGLAIAILTLLLSIGYIVSSFLSDEQMKAWTKKEIGQAVYSAIILLVAILLVDSMNYWIKEISLISESQEWGMYVNRMVCCQPPEQCINSPVLAKGKPCHIALAKDYLQILYESGMAQASSHMWQFYAYNTVANLGLAFRLIAFINFAEVSIRPFAFLSVQAEFHSILFELTMKTLLFTRMQQIFLDFLWVAFFPLMLSMGLVLRTFYFTRKLGGLLASLGLAAYLVLPMFYVLCSAILFGFMGGFVTNSYTHATFANNFDPTNSTNIVSGFSSVSPGVNSSSLDTDMISLNATAEQAVEHENTVDLLKQQWDGISHSRWGSSSYERAGHAFEWNGPVSHLATLMIYTTVLPFVGLMTTLAAFKYFSQLLGGDIEISLLSRLI